MREEDTNTWKLFHQQFEVSMPQAFAYLNPHSEQRGVFVSKDKALERELANMMVTTYRTLNDLVELCDAGARLVFNRVDDIPVAHQILQGFLDEWVERLELNDIVGTTTPEDVERLRVVYKDIKKVEEFTQYIIPAVIRLKPAQKRSESMQLLHSILGITTDGLNAAASQEAAEFKPVPFEDRLSRGAATRARRWR